MQSKTTNWTKVTILFIGLSLGLARFFIPKHVISPAGSYEAVAHLFIGALITYCWVTKDLDYYILLFILCIVELLAFFFLHV